MGGGGDGGGGAQRGVCVHGVVVRVCVRVRVGRGVRDGQRQLAAATRPPRPRLGVVESLRGSGRDRGVGRERWRGNEAKVVAWVLGDAVCQPLMLLGMRGSAAGRGLPLGGGEPVREGVVLRHALHMVAVVVMVRRRRWRLRLLLRMPRGSASCTVAVAVLGVQGLELGRPPSQTAGPSSPARVGRSEVGRWGGAWGRGGRVGDGRGGGGVVGWRRYHQGTRWTLWSRRRHRQGTRNFPATTAKEVPQQAATQARPSCHPAAGPSPSPAHV